MQAKTLFVTLTDVSQCQSLLPRAADIALWHESHLEILILGVDRLQTGYYYAGDTAILAKQALERAHADASEIVAEVERVMPDWPTLRWSQDTLVCQIADVSRLVAQRARFSDLCLAAKPYGGENADQLEAVVEGALFGAASPVVILPEAASFAKPRRISLAWNNSLEAMVAARGALPYLSQADLVKLVIIDPPAHGRDRSDPGGAMSEFLARHGCRVEIDVLSKSLPRVADVLLRHADDAAIDLVVMGAYGHSRFREAILGGATRHMLEQTDVPLLMAHA